jgi:hypothetical protein
MLGQPLRSKGREMKFKLISGAVCAVLAASAFAPAGASAATEFGDPCPAVTGAPTPFGLFASTAAGDPLPLAAPVGGILTKWRIQVAAPGPPKAAPVTLKTLRLTGPENLLVTGEGSGSIVAGSNAFDVRIPIQPGDHLGLFGADPELGTPLCTATDENKLGIFIPTTPVGNSSPYAELDEELRVPVTGTIEPDADNDGFGDETQDGCPQSGAVQTACPAVTLSATKQVRKGSVVIVVTTDAPAPVTVKGVAKLGKGKKAKLNGGTKNLTPGVLGKFTLKFPNKVKAKLADLSRKQFAYFEGDRHRDQRRRSGDEEDAQGEVEGAGSEGLSPAESRAGVAVGRRARAAIPETSAARAAKR